MLILDTDALPPQERAEAFQSIISGASSSNLATFDDPADVRALLELYDFGPGRIFNVRATGNTLLRTPRIARGATEQVIALAVPVTGRNRLRCDQEEQLLGPRDMLLVDMASPYEYGWNGSGSSYAFQVSYEHLGLPMHTIRAARPKLPPRQAAAARSNRWPAGGASATPASSLVASAVPTASRPADGSSTTSRPLAAPSVAWR